MMKTQNLKNSTQEYNPLKYGMVIMVVSAIMFAMIYMFSNLMQPLTGTSVFAWRMLGMFIGLLALLRIRQQTKEMKAFLISLRDNSGLFGLSKKGLMMVATTPIIASQLWLFMWAGVNGHAVAVSVGYLLFPLTMVLAGWLFIKEQVTRLQWLAIGLAGMGVAYQLLAALGLMGGTVSLAHGAGGHTATVFSWASFWVCGIYPIYYLLRRQFGVPALLGLTFDLAVIAPFALAYLLVKGELAILLGVSKFWLLIPVLGLLSAWAMRLNLEASSLLSVPMFGILSYLEPTLMFVLSVTLLGETMSATMMVSFALICCGLVVSVVDSFGKL